MGSGLRWVWWYVGVAGVMLLCCLPYQSYGRMAERGKVLQTFVQSVAPGSPSFMAGLYPGDAIIEVDGKNVKYAPVEEVVKTITEHALENEEEW